ncbi:phenoloxidase-activating factor 2-like isoform X1 [Danaus plexippus]|uniref:phenoloxidase-activating factor 2-like isoform X1 n=1 Tax=Danaus plexippus TaxID=13037 RepID=UPI002AB046FB|nr:phenoloxidase-activating factor 2-like isoform X1 [Danaus plexippus]
MLRYITLVLLSIGVFCQREPKKQANDGTINLDPVNYQDNDSEEDSVVDWVNKIISESKINVTNREVTNLNPESVTNINCTATDNRPGTCVLYYQCDEDTNTIIDDGASIVNFRTEASCPHYLKVCCAMDKIKSDDKANTIRRGSNNESAQELDSKGDSDSSSAVVDLGKCGWNNPALYVFQPKRNNSEAEPFYANYGEFPWMIAVIRRSNDTDLWARKNYVGGGTLIHPRVVVTAAHIVRNKKPDDLKCRAGEWDTEVTFEIFPHQERNVKKIIIHPDYYRPSLYNDMGLLLLEEPFELLLAPHIGLACVGNSLPAPGTVCYGMGWGRKIDKKYAIILKKMRLPLVGREECQALLRSIRLGPFFQLHESLTCAGGEDRMDMCKGDGGSSLVCPIQTNGRNVKYAMFGMVAYGLGCHSRKVPGVFVNVPNLKSWLDSTMEAEGYSKDTYTY